MNPIPDIYQQEVRKWDQQIKSTIGNLKALSLRHVASNPVAPKMVVHYPLLCRTLIKPTLIAKHSELVESSFIVTQTLLEALRFTNQKFFYTIRIRSLKASDVAQKHEWPSTLSEIYINNHKVQFSKKTYERTANNLLRTVGEHLPLEVNMYVQKGTNLIKMVMGQEEGFKIGVDLIAWLSRDDAVSAVLAQPRITNQDFYQIVDKLFHPEDDECTIVQEKMELSLTCPITLSRMKFPVKSRNCNHLNVFGINQCFDLLIWLDSYKSGKGHINFSCPVCGSYVDLQSLGIDETVYDILKKTSISTKIVFVYPDHHWETS